jgi:hypothetical protein
MIEVSITEIVLFAWASIATGLYLKTKQEEFMVRKLFMHLIENDEAREEMVKQFKLAQQRGDV